MITLLEIKQRFESGRIIMFHGYTEHKDIYPCTVLFGQEFNIDHQYVGVKIGRKRHPTKRSFLWSAKVINIYIFFLMNISTLLNIYVY